MDKREQSKLIKVARKYYEEDCMQGEIAKELNISRPQVSRFLKKAKNLGIVKITIVDPWKSLYDMEKRIKNHFDLKEVRVVEAEQGAARVQQLGYAAAEFLSEILKDGDTIGIAWGTTLYQMVTQIRDNLDFKDLRVVQVKGGMMEAKMDMNPFEIPRILAKKLNADLCYLPIPVLVDSFNVRKTLCNDSGVKKALNWADDANIIIYSIGAPTKNSIMAKCGYIPEEQLDLMRHNGAVGDICSRFFDINGQIYDKELNDRTTSIPLEELKTKEYSIGIAGGKSKFKAVLGALKGRHLNTLIIDKETADWLINIIEAEEEKNKKLEE